MKDVIGVIGMEPQPLPPRAVIARKIIAGDYDHGMEYPHYHMWRLTKKEKAQRREDIKLEQQRLDGVMKQDIKDAYGMHGHPRFERAYEIAYRQRWEAHNGGLMAVLEAFDELARLIR